jgi:hypothetical protein
MPVNFSLAPRILFDWTAREWADDRERGFSLTDVDAVTSVYTAAGSRVAGWHVALALQTRPRLGATPSSVRSLSSTA